MKGSEWENYARIYQESMRFPGDRNPKKNLWQTQRTPRLRLETQKTAARTKGRKIPIFADLSLK
jgi:hypothetical protein